MAGSILTPNLIWSDFEIGQIPSAEIIDTSIDCEVNLTRLYIEGRDVQDGKVVVYGLLARTQTEEKLPAILLLQDFASEMDLDLIKDLAKRGYAVLAIDLAGASENKDIYTVYPDSISYANYETVKNELYYIKGNVKNSCWYEWGVATRYALSYLINQPFVSRVGGFGIGEAATVLWMVAGTDKSLSSAVFALNAGWSGYRGIHKFEGKVEPHFSDNMYKFIAGVEPQAYAMHISCPTLLLTATNSSLYDSDRAYDTITRINAYKAVHYSVGYRERVSGEGYRDALIFMEEFLIRGAVDQILLPEEPEIKSEIVDGKIRVEVIADEKWLKEVSIMVAEEIINPCERAWQKISTPISAENGKYVFDYSPYAESGIITVFGNAKYKNGFVLDTNVIAKRFTKEEIKSSFKNNIIYSSRESNLETAFSAAHQPGLAIGQVNIVDRKRVKVERGPMGINGLYCEWGLVTFKIAAKKFMPREDAMLMFDVYAKNSGTVTVKLIADYFGPNKIVFSANFKISGGEVWYNLKADHTRFKTAEGRVLKDYKQLNAIEFDFDNGEYLINNALWV